MRPILALPLALSACVAAVDAVPDVGFQSPVVYGAPLGDPYTYLCDDGRAVVARYAGMREAEIRWGGRTATLYGVRPPDRHVRSGLPRGVGYARDDIGWDRHGAEALLRNGAVTTACRVTAAPAGQAAPGGPIPVPRDPYDPLPRRPLGKL